MREIGGGGGGRGTVDSTSEGGGGSCGRVTHVSLCVCVCVEGGRGRGSQQFSDVLVLVCCACKMSHQPPQHSTLHFNRVRAPGLAGSHCPAEPPGMLRGQVQESAMSARTSAL